MPYLASVAICAGTGLFAWKRRAQDGAGWFIALTVFEVEWILAYLGQALSPGLSAKLFWNNAQFLGAVLTPLAYFGFAFTYTGRRPEKWNWVWAILSVLTAGMLALIWTDGLHHLFRIAPHLQPGSPFSNLIWGNGPLFGLYPIYAYLLLVVSTLILAAQWLAAPHIYRFQIGVVLAGILIPWIASIVTELNLVPYQLHDVTPLTFGVCNLVIAWALFRYRLLESVPVARDLLVEGMSEGVIVLDPKLRVIDFNPAAQRLLEAPINQLVGLPLGERIPGLRERLLRSEPGQFIVALSRAEGSEGCEYEATLTRLDGSAGMRKGTSGGWLVILRDVTIRRKEEEQLRRLAITDPLTGLYNRRHFFDLAEGEIERARRYHSPLSIMIFDVDNFKQVNDTYGHQVGDQALAGLARICQASLRAVDIIARYGGEEFALLLPGADATSAWQAAERLRALAETVAVETTQGTVGLTISLGIASQNQDLPLSLDQLIGRADKALYLSKTRGRNQVAAFQYQPEKLEAEEHF